ncbi:STAS domain-containing protein [Actinosynnema sp. NPDC020468]|uniref:STAS domain-containing protein n=1 Tax=Actinosynnema sp. NPDC020468 TaxID=3154488 RepID=UPI0033DE71DD
MSPRPWDGALRTTRHLVDGTSVMAVTGEVDDESAPALRHALTVAVNGDDSPSCVVDLSGVTFLNSAGLTALVEVAWHAETRRRRLRLVVDANRLVIRPIELTGLDRSLSLHHTVAEAAAHSPQRTN